MGKELTPQAFYGRIAAGVTAYAGLLAGAMLWETSGPVTKSVHILREIRSTSGATLPSHPDLANESLMLWDNAGNKIGCLKGVSSLQDLPAAGYRRGFQDNGSRIVYHDEVPCEVVSSGRGLFAARKIHSIKQIAVDK